MNKKLILTGLIGIMAVSLVTGCGCEKKDKDKDKDTYDNSIVENKNKDVIKDQTVENTFEFKNTALFYEKGNQRTTLQTEVKNISNVDQNGVIFKINLYKGDELLLTLDGFIGEGIKAGESKIVNSACGEDLSEATRIEYTVVRSE